MSRMKLGAFLLKHHFVSEKSLEEALQNQSLLGGRLGTNLVEIGVLQLDQLEIYLGQFYGIKPVNPGDLDHINPNLLQSVPKRLVEQHRFLPLAKAQNTLRIAVMDTDDAGRSQALSAVLGVPVELYICAEIRFLFYLDHYYQIKADVRYRSLYYHYRKSKSLGRDLGTLQTVDTGKLTLLKKGFKPLGEGEELTDEGFEEYLMRETILREAPAPEKATPAIPAFATPEDLPPSTPVQKGLMTLDDLNRRLPNLEERLQVGDCALEFACQFVEAVVLFVVNSGLISAWNARSPVASRKLSRDTIGTLILPLSLDSIFRTVSETKSHFKGRLAPTPLNMRLLAALNIPATREVLVIPIWLKKRLVNILFADHGAEGFSTASFNALIALSGWLSRAYEHLIISRKKNLQS